jgi:hypothetical protein
MFLFQLFQLYKKDPKFTFDKAYCEAKSILELLKNNYVKKCWLHAIYDIKPDTELIYKGIRYF